MSNIFNIYIIIWRIIDKNPISHNANDSVVLYFKVCSFKLEVPNKNDLNICLVWIAASSIQKRNSQTWARRDLNVLYLYASYSIRSIFVKKCHLNFSKWKAVEKRNEFKSRTMQQHLQYKKLQRSRISSLIRSIVLTSEA